MLLEDINVGECSIPASADDSFSDNMTHEDMTHKES
jgi:hypothetical protein